MKVATGAVSTTMPAYVSQPTPSSWPKGHAFPPSACAEAQSASKDLPFPLVADGEVPLRPERHQPMSITTLRKTIITYLSRRLPRCPTCHHPTPGRFDVAIGYSRGRYDLVF